MAEKLYRVWDKEAQKYYSTGKKSIWKSETWAVNAVKDIRNAQSKDYEIHVIEQVVTERKEAHTLVQTAKDVEKNRENARKEHSNVIRKINEITGLDFHVTRMLYGQKRFVASEMEKIRPLMETIYGLEKLI